jgi:hypothetical protein
MTNNRIFYAVQAAGIARIGSTSFTEIHGLQSIGITTTFNLEQVFEIGQISIYENIEDIPDIEVTLEKVIDGYPLIYHLATRGSTTATLSGRSNALCQVALSIFGDTQDSASGTPQTQVTMSGMFTSALTYTMPTEGSCTESITLVGNHKRWISSAFTFSGSIFDNTDEPLAVTSGLGGVQRRENVLFTDLTGTLLPTEIPGISSSGTNDKTADVYGAHVSQITVSTDLGRTNINELGRRAPYYRFVEFPVEVTTEIEVITTQGDNISATEDGVAGAGNNLTAHTIQIALEDSTLLYMGTQNKLQSVTYGGADAGGGQASVTYSYITQNDLTVTHDQDPG